MCTCAASRAKFAQLGPVPILAKFAYHIERTGDSYGHVELAGRLLSRTAAEKARRKRGESMRRGSRATTSLVSVLIVLGGLVGLPAPLPAAATCYEQYQAALEECGYNYHGSALVMCAAEAVADYIGCIRRKL